MHKKNSGCHLRTLNDTGAVLIITLLLLTFLTGLVVEFAYGVYIGTSTLSNWSDAQKASLIAKSGQSLTSNYIKEIRELSYTYNDEVLLPVEFDFGPYTKLSVKLEDENARFNINSIIYPNGLTKEKAMASLQMLFKHLKINPSLALSIADWIDPDSNPRTGNSEYNAKNSILWDIEEIKFIQGIDKKIFSKISPFITVYGNELININTATLPVLVSLSNDMTEVLAEKIIYYRESTPFEDKNHIIRVAGLESIGIKLLDRITVKSTDFRVISRAEVNSTVRVIESVMDISMKIHLWREG